MILHVGEVKAWDAAIGREKLAEVFEIYRFHIAMR